MDTIFIPFIVASCIVLVVYLCKGHEKETSKQPNYIVLFCVGLLLAYGGMYLFGGGSGESLQNLMMEIDTNQPSF